VFEQAIACQYASLTRAGAPVTLPTTPYVGSGTLDVSTGLTYPAKAERARRNPKVALLFADPIGAGAAASQVVLVQGHAAVRDADLQANTDRYLRVSTRKLPEVTKGQPKMLIKRFAFYYARIWIEITPLRVRWWADRDLAEQPQEWIAPAGEPPQSDPAPLGHQPPAWRETPGEWREGAARAVRTLPLADLTVLDGEGYPLCLPVAPGELRDDAIALRLGAGAPALAPGPACLTIHGHDEQFSSQENHTLMGSLEQGADGLTLRVERALANWSLIGNRAQIALGFMRDGLRLRPRLKAEAQRRGQPVPSVDPS